MDYKQLMKSMAVITLSCLSSFAFAAERELKIINETNEPSTCKTHKCSSDMLGSLGITPPHDSRTYSVPKIRIACKDNLDRCQADVFMTNNCGPDKDKIATAVFSLKNGILSITPTTGHNYVITGTPGSNVVTISYKN